MTRSLGQGAFLAPSDDNKSFAARNRSAAPSNGILNLNLSCPSSAYTPRLRPNPLHDRQRLDIRLRPEDHASSVRAELELLDAERRRRELELRHREEMLHGIRQ